MIGPLPIQFFKFFLIVCLALGVSRSGFSQGCLGANGTGVFTGGAVSTNSGFLCANIDALGGAGSGAIIDLTAGNIAGGDVVTFTVDWDDGSGSPVLAATQTGPTTWSLLNLKHIFPTTGANVKCQYVATVTLLINGVPCISPFGSPPVFTRWNVDSENSGRLLLGETITGAATYFVCKGTETTVSFTDNSTLNCVPPEAAPNNTLQRWRRFTYGTTNTITSATGVKVGGVVQGYPFQGAVINGPAPITTPVPPPNTQSITIPADAAVGQEFDIQMEYWNTCNPYPTGTAVTQTARIVVVDQPPSPTANVTAPICSGGSLPNYSITLPGGFTTSIVTWFQDNANRC